MAAVSSSLAIRKNAQMPRFFCRKKEKDRGGQSDYPYSVTEISPPPKNLGIRCLPSNLQSGESVTIEGQAYTISAVTHRYQLRKGKYEPREKRKLEVLVDSFFSKIRQKGSSLFYGILSSNCDSTFCYQCHVYKTC